jgi:hypothetical protein
LLITGFQSNFHAWQCWFSDLAEEKAMPKLSNEFRYSKFASFCEKDSSGQCLQNRSATDKFAAKFEDILAKKFKRGKNENKYYNKIAKFLSSETGGAGLEVGRQIDCMYGDHNGIFDGADLEILDGKRKPGTLIWIETDDGDKTLGRDGKDIPIPQVHKPLCDDGTYGFGSYVIPTQKSLGRQLGEFYRREVIDSAAASMAYDKRTNFLNREKYEAAVQRITKDGLSEKEFNIGFKQRFVNGMQR